ncbi:MAG: HD domain-containing protein [Polyangiaceae bacterium]
MSLNPPTVSAARSLLSDLGAPPRLLRHVELVGEAAELLVAQFEQVGAPLRADLVWIGVVLHDTGKVVHQGELNGPGGEHEPEGERLLLARGVTAELARICMSHARWRQMEVSTEELVVALADKLWKGVRNAELEERTLDVVAKSLGKERWDLFVEFDTLFEDIAAGGAERLERSRY